MSSRAFSITFILSLFLILPGCDNNNVVSPEAAPQKQLSKITEDANNYRAFTYSGDKLINYLAISNSQIISQISLHYEGKNLPQIEEYSDTGVKNFIKITYDASDRIIRRDYFDPGNSEGQAKTYVKYFYNTAGQLIKYEQYNFNSADSSMAFIYNGAYSYDESGNITRFEVFDAKGTLSTTHIYTYDNKINPMYKLKNYLFFFYSFNKNNMLSETTIYGDGSLPNEVVTFSYTYDSEGYPLTRKISEQRSSTVTNQKYEYR